MTWIFLALLLGSSCSQAISKAASKKVPDFSLPALTGGPSVAFSEVNKENPVLLIFWATWCPSCIEEVPQLNEIQKKFSGRGLKIIAVDVQESKKEILDFQKKQPMNYPVLLDEEGAVAEKMGLEGIPVAILAEPGGNVLYFGFSIPENLETLLQTKGKA